MRWLLLLALGGGVAGAAPWRVESGLSLPAAPGSAPLLDAPISVDGVESPYTTWRKLTLGLSGDAFATYRLRQHQDQLTNEFELSRLQLMGYARYAELGGANVTFEVVRSAGPGSYQGIDGDSLVPRIKFAFAEITPLRHWLAVRAGVIPDLVLGYLESSWSFRMQGPTGPERDGMFTPGDLGISVEASLPWGLGSVGVAYGNGEGTHQHEQNNGKNTTVALRLRPLRYRNPGLQIHFLYRDGSIGGGSAADRRLSGGVMYAGRLLGAGAFATWAMGWQGIGGRDAADLSLWARGELPRRFFLLGRLDLLWPNVSDSGAVQTRLIGGVAYALPSIVRLLVGYEGTLALGALSSQVPALSEHNLLIQVEGRI